MREWQRTVLLLLMLAAVIGLIIYTRQASDQSLSVAFTNLG